MILKKINRLTYQFSNKLIFVSNIRVINHINIATVSASQKLTDTILVKQFSISHNMNQKSQIKEKKKEFTNESVPSMEQEQQQLPTENPIQQPENSSEKFKNAIKQYGSTVIVFHITVSLISLGICYLIISSGLDITKILDLFGISDNPKLNAIATNAGTFVIAYTLHKIFAPARVIVTLSATPFIVRYLRKIGVLKKNQTN